MGSTFLNQSRFKSIPDWTDSSLIHTLRADFSVQSTWETSRLTRAMLWFLFPSPGHYLSLELKQIAKWMDHRRLQILIRSHFDKQQPPGRRVNKMQIPPVMFHSIHSSTWTSYKFQISCSFSTFASLNFNADNHTIEIPHQSQPLMRPLLLPCNPPCSLASAAAGNGEAGAHFSSWPTRKFINYGHPCDVDVAASSGSSASGIYGFAYRDAFQWIWRLLHAGCLGEKP